MKKLFLLSALLIFACSSDDGNDNNNILPVRRIMTYIHSSGNEVLRVWDYNFSAKKLISCTRTTTGWSEDYNYNNRIVTFTNIYEGELISKMIIYTSFIDASDFQDNVSEYEYEYDNNDRLIRKTTLMTPGTSTTPLTVVSVENYNYLNNGLTVQVTNEEEQIIKIFNFDNNFNLIEAQYFDESGIVESTEIFTYDDKNYIFKNAETSLGASIYNQSNNRLTTNYSDGGTSSRVYSYNESNFPIAEQYVNNFGTIYNYIIEYNE